PPEGQPPGPPPAPVAPAPPPVPAPAPAAAAGSSPCAPEAELAVVQRAQRWLGSSPDQALRQLDGFASQWPDGALMEERLATRAIALCVGDRAAEGRADLSKLVARNPSSPALVRVREACAEH